jgi:hypothetical protein
MKLRLSPEHPKTPSNFLKRQQTAKENASAKTDDLCGALVPLRIIGPKAMREPGAFRRGVVVISHTGTSLTTEQVGRRYVGVLFAHAP